MGLGGFHGHCCSALTADREKIRAFTRLEENREWADAVDGVFDRWLRRLRERLPDDSVQRATLRYLVNLSALHRDKLPVGRSPGLWSYRECGSAFSFSLSSLLSWEAFRADNRDRIFVNGLSHDRDRDLGFDLHYAVDRAIEREVPFAKKLRRDYDRARDSDQQIADAHSLALGRAFDLTLDHHPQFTFNIDHQRLGLTWRESLETNLVNEGFWPSLPAAFPLLRLPISPDGLAAARMIAPTVLNWAPGASAVSLLHDYDLVFPFSVIAQPGWLTRVPAWTMTATGAACWSSRFLNRVVNWRPKSRGLYESSTLSPRNMRERRRASDWPKCKLRQSGSHNTPCMFFCRGPIGGNGLLRNGPKQIGRSVDTRLTGI